MNMLDSLKDFIDDNYIVTDSTKDYVRLTDLYDDYTGWCMLNKITTFYNRTTFAKKVVELGIPRKRSNDGFRYLCLKKAADEGKNTFLYYHEEAEEVEKDSQDISLNIDIKNNTLSINIEVK